jgi:hypothetical protein
MGIQYWPKRDAPVKGKLEPCEDCGNPKSEYVDLGTKGVYRCWWCNHRAAGSSEVMT